VTDTQGDVAMQLWRTVAIALMTFILGFGVPFIINRTAVTKDDLTNSLVPIQRQLDDHSSQLGEIKENSKQTDIDVARIATKLNITARPVP
jgi:hypothetical protein